MLIIRRKIDEIIRIGNNIQVKILNFNETQISIGIQAPQAIRILREEIYIKLKKSKKTRYTALQ